MRLDGTFVVIKINSHFQDLSPQTRDKAVQESGITKNGVVFLHVCNKTAIYR